MLTLAKARWSWAFCVAVVALAFSTLLSTGAYHPHEKSSIVSLGRVVATVDGRPIYESEVEPFIRPPPPRVGAGPRVDPRSQALNEAINTALFAVEARRRGLEVPVGSQPLVRAQLAQALIREELTRHAVRLDTIRPVEAFRYYDSHREIFSPTESVELAAIVVEDSSLAENLLRQAEGTTKLEFARLVNDYSIDRASRARDGKFAVIDEHGRGAEDAVARLAMWMRKAGAVGLVHGSDDRYYVLRATRVELSKSPWSSDLSLRVRNYMAHQREQRLIKALARRLRSRAQIVIDDKALLGLVVPTWAEYAAKY